LNDGGDLSPFHSKSVDWSYEEEYRLIAQESKEALGSGTLMTHDSLYQFSTGALLSIIVGASAGDAIVRELTNLAEGSGIIIRKAIRMPDRYQLTILPPI
jgi:hypothetical protein